MARRLRQLVTALTFDPNELALREGLDAPVSRNAPTWRSETVAPGGPHDVNRRWTDAAGGAHAHKVHAPTRGGGYARFPAGSALRYVVRTAHLSGLGVRGFFAVDPMYDLPAGTTITWRISDAANEFRWDPGAGPAAWVVAGDDDDDDEWSSTAILQTNVAAYTGARFGLVARLELSPQVPPIEEYAQFSPAFFGCRVAYNVRDRGDEQDALVRTLQRWLRSGLFTTVIDRVGSYAGSGPVNLAPEWGLQVLEVTAFNVTDDPGELLELSGTVVPLVAGNPGTPATWTPDTPPAAGKALLLELKARPDVVVRRSRELEEVSRLPAVRIFPTGAADALGSQGTEPFRSEVLDGGAPVLQVDPSGMAHIRQELEMVLIAQTATDARRLASAVGDLLGAAGYRSLVSPETGRIVTVHALTPFTSSGGNLAGDVTELRAVWEIGYEARHVRTFPTVPFVRPGGVSTTTSED